MEGVGRRAELAAVVAAAEVVRDVEVGGKVGRVWRLLNRRHAVTIGLPKMLISPEGAHFPG
jgi:hypothetical protein